MKEQQLTVALRIRPLSEAEAEEGVCLVARRVGEQKVVLMDPSEDPDDILRANISQEKTFVFDMVFDHRATQQKPTGVAAGKMTPRLHSPISPDLHGKKSSAAIAAVPLSLETLREIAANTKSISLVAAGRRSQAQCRDPGSKVSSACFSEDDMLELKDLEVSSTPGCQTSIGGVLSEPTAASQLCSPARGALRSGRDQEMSAERTARMKRSRSLEPNFHRTSKDKHWTPSSPNTDKACERHLCQARLFHQSKTASSTSIATKVKVPVGHRSEGTPLEVLPKHNSPASTIQNNAGRIQGWVLQKQVKGPADGASSRQKQQSVTHWGSQLKIK